MAMATGACWGGHFCVEPGIFVSNCVEPCILLSNRAFLCRTSVIIVYISLYVCTIFICHMYADFDFMILFTYGCLVLDDLIICSKINFVNAIQS